MTSQRRGCLAKVSGMVAERSSSVPNAADRRMPPGYQLELGLTPVALAFGLVVQTIIAGSAVHWAALLGVLALAVVCFAPLKMFVGAADERLADSGGVFAGAAAGNRLHQTVA
jgi:hypothetical protein